MRKGHRQTNMDRLNKDSLEKVRLEYEEQCRRLPDMQDAKVLAKLSEDILQCIKSITDWHKIEDCLLPDKTTLIHFLECKWDRSYPYYEINNGIRCQKWEHVPFNREGNLKEIHITEHIHEWLTLLGLIAKSINSSLVTDFAHCLSVLGSWPCESGGLEHDIAVDVVERLLQANAELQAEVSFCKDVRFPYRIDYKDEVTEDGEDVENCEDEDEAFERDERNVTKIFNELYGNSIYDIAALESGFARLVSEIKENKLSPR